MRHHSPAEWVSVKLVPLSVVLKYARYDVIRLRGDLQGGQYPWVSAESREPAAEDHGPAERYSGECPTAGLPALNGATVDTQIGRQCILRHGDRFAGELEHVSGNERVTAAGRQGAVHDSTSVHCRGNTHRLSAFGQVVCQSARIRPASTRTASLWRAVSAARSVATILVLAM